MLIEIVKRIYCPCSGWQEWKPYIGRCLFGITLSLIFWKLLMINFNFSTTTRYAILLCLLIVVAVGSTFSAGVRCICLLIFVNVLGDAGRGYLRALCFTLIISGPIANIVLNAQEVVRCFSCSTVLMYNLTRVKYELLTSPLQNFVEHMAQHNVADLETNFGSFKNVVRPLRNEIESSDPGNITFKDPIDSHFVYGRRLRNDVSRGAEIQHRYMEKLKKRCKLQLSKSKERCYKIFERAHANCESKFPFIVRSLLCWPFKLDIICKVNMFGNPDRICNPQNALPSDFGDNFAELENIEKQFTNDNNRVNIKIKVNNLEPMNDTSRLLIGHIKERSQIFNTIISLIHRMLSFFFIRLIYDAIKYEWNYTHDLDHDNIYLTDYFKHVDQRLKSAGKHFVLPLKKHESKHLIDLKHQLCKRSQREYRSHLFQFLQFALELTVGIFFVMFDIVVVDIMHIIRARSETKFTREGATCVQFHVKGEGSIANLMRAFLKGFNTHKAVYTYLDNKVCLPNASELPVSFYIQLLLLYLLVVLLIFCSTILLRGQRFICAYFYRKREKRRILYLYEKLLMQRRISFERFKQKVHQNATKEQVRREINLALRLRLAYPSSFNWLKCFNFARCKCVVCGDFEAITSITCCNCRMLYCYACIQDVGIDCLVCHQPINMVNEFNVGNYFEEVNFASVDSDVTQPPKSIKRSQRNSFKKCKKSPGPVNDNENYIEKQRKRPTFCCRRTPKESKSPTPQRKVAPDATQEPLQESPAHISRANTEKQYEKRKRRLRRRVHRQRQPSTDTSTDPERKEALPRTSLNIKPRYNGEEQLKTKPKRNSHTMFSRLRSSKEPAYMPLRQEEGNYGEAAEDAATARRSSMRPLLATERASGRAPIVRPEEQSAGRSYRDQQTSSDANNNDTEDEIVAPRTSLTQKRTSKSKKNIETNTKRSRSSILSYFKTPKEPEYRRLTEETIDQNVIKDTTAETARRSSMQPPPDTMRSSMQAPSVKQEEQDGSTSTSRFRRKSHKKDETEEKNESSSTAKSK